ncbi:MAG TPA: hypothetical protein GXZ59_00780 [Clostridiaceae bacterium]|nr:hypothetical protein [Clostridiaceae bacterium]
MMLSKKSAKLVYALGVFFVILALITNLTEVEGVKTRTFLAVGGNHNAQIYFLTMLPLLVLLAVNTLNLLLSSRILRIIALITNGLFFIWGIVLFYVLEANPQLKTLPALFLIMACITFFIGTLKTHPIFDEE